MQSYISSYILPQNILRAGTQNPSYIVWEMFCMGYTKSFLYSVGDVLRGDTQSLPYM